MPTEQIFLQCVPYDAHRWQRHTVTLSGNTGIVTLGEPVFVEPTSMFGRGSTDAVEIVTADPGDVVNVHGVRRVAVHAVHALPVRYGMRNDPIASLGIPV